MNSKVKSANDKTPKGKASKDSAASRKRILEAAVKLFARHGYAGTGLRELATAADVNLAMINYFFGSKKGLLKEILDDFFEGYLRVARHQLQREGDVADKLEGFIREAVHYFARQRDCLVVVITELPHDDPEVIEHKAAWGKQMMSILATEICQPLSQQRGHPLSPLFLGPTLTSIMASRFLFAPISQQLGGTDAQASTDQYARELSQMVLHGLIGQG